jgi:hypothetical protein
LRYDSSLYMELSFCTEHGIPHSEFLDWEPDDRAKALAFVIEKSARCDMCGTAQWEWDKDPFAYEPVEKMCKGCYLKHMAQEGSGAMPGTTVSLEPTRGVQAAKRRSSMRRQYG